MPKRFTNSNYQSIIKQRNKNATAQRLENFGENVRYARKEWGFTAELFASFIGISAGHVGMIERAERTPSLELFIKICNFLGEDMGEMLMPRTTHRLVLDGPSISKPFRPF